jgi:serine/threonine protein kinase
MSVTIGDTVGGYEILSLLGKGGMGEVYRARDTKLGREVAIKVLASALAESDEFLARFEREARLLASLNHPNIATLHGLEVAESPQPERSASEASRGARAVGVGPRGPEEIRFLVMELVQGDTLRERIKMSGPVHGRGERPGLPLEEALPIFQQIAEALEAAHEKGVVHRDLKPANIKLTPDDKVKVLDFGLAKRSGSGPASGDLSESPTITRAAMETGMLLGTAGYMSPEQARGKAVDKRTDIWAFGCCMYETLTGRPTFDGETLSDTLAAILKGNPDWEWLPESTPASVRQLLRRCLSKDPHRRYRDVWDVRLQIEEALNEPDESSQDVVVAPPPSALSRMAPWLAVGFFALAAAAVGIWTWTATVAPAPGPVTKLRLSTPPLEGNLAVSPDGSRLAYPANGRLYVRPMDQLDAKALGGTDGATNPFFSPDGEWVGFFADDKLKKVEVAGGTPTSLCDAADVSDRFGRPAAHQ